MSNLPPSLLAFLNSPQALAALVHGLAFGIEAGAPDYTLAHRVAAALDHLLGYAPRSTPTAQSAAPIPQAIALGVEAAVPGVVSAVNPKGK